MMIKALRTPDDCFSRLPNFDYDPNYINSLPGYGALRVHYLDEGPKDAEHTFLCLHGQPTWSYLYRKMIPVFLQARGRVVAPDLLGFGRSDKPVDEDVYTFSFHRDMLISFVKTLDLQNITLVCQDWGGILGLTLPMDLPGRFKRLIVMNTTVATGQHISPGFDAWRAYNRANPDLPISRLMQRSVEGIATAEADAYDAPFPDAAYKAGVRRFPELVMTDPGMDGVKISQQAQMWWQNEWSGQSFMAVGMQDPVLGSEVMNALRNNIRNCPSPLEVPEAGHFVQEHGANIAHAAIKAFEDH